MFGIFEHVRDRISGRVPKGKKRSSEWPGVRQKHLAWFPVCACCGSGKSLQVHHIKPFHLHPELELEQTNLITLCARCHLLIGHLNNFQSLNPEVVSDSKSWRAKIASRPKTGE